MDSTMMKLEADLDFRAAAPLRDAFLELRGADVAVDASGVERIGALCLQVLLSARETWRADGRILHMQHPSDELRAHLRWLGASDLC